MISKDKMDKIKNESTHGEKGIKYHKKRVQKRKKVKGMAKFLCIGLIMSGASELTTSSIFNEYQENYNLKEYVETYQEHLLNREVGKEFNYQRIANFNMEAQENIGLNIYATYHNDVLSKVEKDKIFEAMNLPYLTIEDYLQVSNIKNDREWKKVMADEANQRVALKEMQEENSITAYSEINMKGEK